MEPGDLRELLEQVRTGTLSIDGAFARLDKPVEINLGYAHVDLQRRQRCGFPEVIFSQGKTSEWVEGVVRQLLAAGQDCLATRVSDEQAAMLALHFPEGQQDRVARTFWLPQQPRPATVGRVVVITAGTSDLPVAREAVVTAQALGRQSTYWRTLASRGCIVCCGITRNFKAPTPSSSPPAWMGHCQVSSAAWSIAP